MVPELSVRPESVDTEDRVSTGELKVIATGPAIELRTTRNPTYFSMTAAGQSARYATRQLPALYSPPPPRRTLYEPEAVPRGFVCVPAG